MRSWVCGSWFLGAVVVALIAAAPVFASGDASVSNSCVNEAFVGFSASLSECRGIEMVTPPYEEGEEPSLRALSTDGISMINKSLGTYSGRQNGSTGATYLIGRGGAGWASVALSASSAMFPAQEYLSASSDLTRSLWRLRSASEPITGEDLYLREADGRLIKIGSFVPPADEHGPAAGDDVHFFGQTNVNYLDASNDLSHIAFDIKKPGPLWPFDATLPEASNHSSLYEYTGTSAKQPVLVGVSDGSTILRGVRSNPGEPNEPEPFSEVLPSGSLISDCQTSLGSGTADGYNAMSEDGETIFFTAAGIEGAGGSECRSELVENYRDVTLPHAPAVNELFARIGGVETVPVSEPPVGVCVSCQSGELERAGEFAGASDDGSKAIFLSEQEYFAGESGMNVFEYDFDAPAGEHLLPVSGASGAEVLGVARVSEDGSHVYFVAKNVLAGNTNEYGRSAVSGEPNLYLFVKDASHPRGKLIFITPLSSEDSDDWEAGDAERRVTATPDGQFLVFVSRVNVASPGASIGGLPQVFEYNATSGELARVSRGENGFAEGTEDADSSRTEMPFQNYQTSGKALGPTRTGTELAVSADGSTVAFSSPGALTRTAREETGVRVLGSESETNAYVFHSDGGVLSSGEVYLVAARVHLLEGLDASGDDVFFKTGVALLPFDGDGAMDVYDARIDGGVTAPGVAPSCIGEGCLGPATVARSALEVTSGSGTGGGNIVERLPGAKATVITRHATSRAQLLSAALKRCRRGNNKLRESCQMRARRKYGTARPKRITHRAEVQKTVSVAVHVGVGG